MMTRDEINVTVYAVLCSLKEAGDTGAPEGHLYAALMSRWPAINVMWWEKFVRLLTASDLATKHGGPVLVITEKGKRLVADVEAANETGNTL